MISKKRELGEVSLQVQRLGKPGNRPARFGLRGAGYHHRSKFPGHELPARLSTARFVGLIRQDALAWLKTPFSALAGAWAYMTPSFSDHDPTQKYPDVVAAAVQCPDATLLASLLEATYQTTLHGMAWRRSPTQIGQFPSIEDLEPG